MAEYARVRSIDALRSLREGLLAFMQAAAQSVTEAEVDIERTVQWLGGDQASYWKAQRRRRAEEVHRAKLALERKRIMPTASGLPPSTVDQEAALAAARRRLAEADEKIEAVRTWRRRIEKERMVYKSAMAPLRGLLDSDLPKAAGELEAMLDALDAYVRTQAHGAEAPPEAAVRLTQPAPEPQPDNDDEPGDQ